MNERLANSPILFVYDSINKYLNLIDKMSLHFQTFQYTFLIISKLYWLNFLYLHGNILLIKNIVFIRKYFINSKNL